MKKLALIALTLTMAAYAAGLRPSVVTEVESELHPPNEVMRELHPDRYKSKGSGVYDYSRIPDYGRTPTY